jgi:hypothetical protein
MLAVANFELKNSAPHQVSSLLAALLDSRPNSSATFAASDSDMLPAGWLAGWLSFVFCVLYSPN